MDSTSAEQGTPPEAPGPGALIADRYRLEARLGSGTFALVHRATDVLTRQPVAVKLMGLPIGEELGVWRQEVAMLRRANLPGVVELLDEGRALGHSFIVMSLVSGSPFPGRDTATSWADIEQTSIGMLKALDRLHWAGLVHRDIKPENVLVGSDGRPTIVDLGIALDRGFDTQGMSQAALAGSPLYMAPELFRGHQQTPSSDLYSVGVMLFETLAGIRPHASPSMSQLIRARTHEAAPTLRSVVPDVPERVAETVDRLLELAPSERPQSAAAAIVLLRGDKPAHLPLRDFPPPEAHPGEPMTEAALRSLFAGAERLLHIPEDAAHELWLRTAGLPGRVTDELDAWVRAGIARSEGERVVISRGSIERLQVDPVLHAASPEAADVPADGERDRLLAHIELCGAGATTDQIAVAIDRTVEEALAELETLDQSGAVLRAGDAWVLVERAPRGPAWSSPSARADVHRRIAGLLAPGDLRRLHHVVAAGAVDEVVREASATAKALSARGRSGQAVAALLLGLTVARSGTAVEAGAVDRLLSQLLSAALTAHSREAVDVLLYQASRAPNRTPVVEGVEHLARAAAHGQRGNAGRSLRSLEVPLPAGCESLEYERHRIRLVTAQFVGEDALKEALLAMRRYVRTTGSQAGRRTLMTWLGWWRYRKLRFAAAARMHARAARTAPTEFDRVSKTVDAAISALDGFDFDHAIALATECRDVAVSARASHAEARSEWVLRSAHYRLGTATTVDWELVDAAAELGVPALEAQILQVEAAVAWRYGRPEDARRLAERALGLAASTGREPMAILLESLAIGSGAPVSSAGDDDLLDRVDQCEIPGLAAQSAAMLSLGGHPAHGRLREVVCRNAERLPSSQHAVRREIVSITEALDFADRACRSDEA